MRKCRNGWHLDDGRGYSGVCSECILRIPHPTLQRMKRKTNDLLSGIYRGRNKHLSDMSQEALAMPMRSRLNTDYKQAASLLKDDLVWSGDFDNIRMDLIQLIERYIKAEIYPEPMTAIVQKLIAEENDLSI